MTAVDSISVTDLPATKEPRRDRYGRYMVLPPDGKKPTPYTRVTTIAKTLDDGGGLAAWKAAMAVQGVLLRRGLRSRWEALIAESPDPWYAGPEQKKKVKKLVEECATAGGAENRSEIGTSLHTITALVDLGRQVQNLADDTGRAVDAYRSGLERYGVSFLDGAVELTVVLDGHQVAGTFDRLAVVTWPGFDLPLVADLKTGSNLKYSWQSIAVQLAAYSRADAIYEQGQNKDGSDDKRLAMPQVDQDHGLVMWLDAGAQAPELQLFVVDLEAGWQAFTHSVWTRAWRNAHVAFSADSLVPKQMDPDQIKELRSWLQRRIGIIGTTEEARKELMVCWPAHFPTLRRSEDHTLEQLEMIEKILDGIEDTFEMPFGEPKPK